MIALDLLLHRGDFSLQATLETDERVLGLFGPSGCGKTSIVHAVAGLLRPERGSIAIGGETLFDSSRGLHLPPERRRCGVVFQDNRLFPHWSVEKNLRGSRPAVGAAGPSFDDVVSLLDLGPLLARPVDTLSGGETRRVALGRALLLRPRILLLDEPLTGLDAERRRHILAYLLRLKEHLDLSMLYVSHTFSDFPVLVDTMGVLRGGRVEALGRPEEILDTVGGDDLETTLPGTVTARDADVASVDCGGATIDVVAPEARVGQTRYLTLRARDVLVSVGETPRTSARNRLGGVVRSLHPAGRHRLLEVDAGPVVWVEVTQEAVDELSLSPGVRVHLLIKATAVRSVALEEPPGALRAPDPRLG